MRPYQVFLLQVSVDLVEMKRYSTFLKNPRTRTSPSDCLVSYAGHALGRSLTSSEIQMEYSTVTADLATHTHTHKHVCAHTHTHTHTHIYIYIFSSVKKLYIHQRSRPRKNYIYIYIYIYTGPLVKWVECSLSVKQGGIKYHFLSLWYDSSWEWTPVSRTIGKHNYIYIYIYIYIYLYIYIYIFCVMWNVNSLVKGSNSCHRVHLLQP